MTDSKTANIAGYWLDALISSSRQGIDGFIEFCGQDPVCLAKLRMLWIMHSGRYLDIYMHKDKPSKRWIVDCPFTGYSLMQGYRGETRDKLAQRFIDCRLDAYLRIIHAKRDETGKPTYFEKLEAQYLRVLANRGDEDD